MERMPECTAAIMHSRLMLILREVLGGVRRWIPVGSLRGGSGGWGGGAPSAAPPRCTIIATSSANRSSDVKGSVDIVCVMLEV